MLLTFMKRKKRRIASALAAAVFAAGIFPAVASADYAVTRIKDIAKVQGVRSNQLMGYGLVVGLNGTGDSNKATETIQSIGNMLKTFGLNIDTSRLKPNNMAAVMVTATLPPFAREGDTIDINVSSLADAKSIQGGTLLQTPLRAGNGEVYAVAQGPVSTGGFVAGTGGGNSAQKNFPTAGTTPGGAIVERSVQDDIGQNGTISLSLSQPDFTTASRMTQTINARFGPVASAANPGEIDIRIPANYAGNTVGFVASIENLPVMPDNTAKVVMNERTGTIVMGGDVAVDECAITQGGLSIQVTKNTDVNQPAPFSYGSTIVTQNTNVRAKEKPANTVVLPATANINDIVGALNAVGATARDTISIILAMKAAGAIHADVQLI